MEQNDVFPCVENPQEFAKSSNVKNSRKYEHFGDIIRYLTVDELQQFFYSVDNSSHKVCRFAARIERFYASAKQPICECGRNLLIDFTMISKNETVVTCEL